MRSWLPRAALAGLGLAAALAAFRMAPLRPSPKVAPYLYEDTRELVLKVERAADLMAREGPAAFTAFRKPDSPWLNDTFYLFIYDLDGICVFHPVTPELVGRNLMELRDMTGKAMVRQIVDIGRRPGSDASGWVFYLWAERSQFTPVWKTSYVRKVVAPDGRVYCLGSGRTSMKIEKVFVKERVDQAAELLRTRGLQAAFADFRDPASPFNFLDTYLFVLDARGCTVIDPSFPGVGARDLSGFQDSVGNYVVKEILRKTQASDEAWVQYMRPRPGEMLPSRKLAYVRKVTVDGEPLLLCADFFLATPIWMKL